MRVLVLYAHPVETSYGAALHAAVLSGLAAAGHTVDDCDLYAEGFEPVLSRAERLAYHTVPDNRGGVASYVERLRACEALVLVHPVWNFGYPAILKGFIDRVFLPGVSFHIEEGRVKPALHNVRTLMAVATYGGDRVRAFLAGDPPRKIATRVLRATIRPGARIRYLAHYDMNRSTDDSRARFLARVRTAAAELG
jgi:putative NADPH-quinone reductase